MVVEIFEENREYKVILDAEGRMSYEDAMRILETINYALCTARINKEVIKAESEVASHRPLRHNWDYFDIYAWEEGRVGQYIQTIKICTSGISIRFDTYKEGGGYDKGTQELHYYPWDGIQEHMLGLIGGASECRALVIGDWSNAVSFCSMEPCSTCGCYMDCVRGGYRK